MKNILALILAFTAVSAVQAAPTAKAVADLKIVEAARQEAVATGTSGISHDAKREIEDASKALNQPTKHATQEDVAAVATSPAFKKAMRDEGVDMFAALP